MPNTSSPSPEAHTIATTLSSLCTVHDELYSSENPRRFSGYARRLQLLLGSSSPATSSSAAAMRTALRGIAADLTKSVETLSVYRSKSRIYVLINCESLCRVLRDRAVAIGGWLALMDSALVEFPEMRKKAADLAAEMKQAQFKI